MSIIEQLVVGTDPNRTEQGRIVLGRSPGIGRDVSAEVVALCESWGAVPPLGLQQPVLMAFPLASTMPALRGPLSTVIRIPSVGAHFFHALILTDGGYETFGRNPYVLAEQGVFLDIWQDDQRLGRRELEPGADVPLTGLAPAESDVGLIDCALEQILEEQRLLLPLEQAVPESDRFMALLIAALPRDMRRQLRFTSFANRDTCRCTLGALASDGGVFASWRRLMMTRLSNGLKPSEREYVQAIRAALEAGDLAGIHRLSRRQLTPLAATRQGPPTTSPRVVTAAVSPALPTAATSRTAARQPAPLRSHRPSTTPDGRTRLVTKDEAPPRRRTRAPSPRRRPPGQRIGGAITAVCLLAIVGTGIGWWLTGDHPAGFAELWSRFGGRGPASPARTGSLFEVVGVGEIYDRLRVRATRDPVRSGGELSRDRLRALATLQADAAGPLLQQVDLFSGLAADGIQQGDRPDRETERLRAMAQFGRVLEHEVARLEIAWASLVSGRDWRDVAELSDERLMARRDSLRRVDAPLMERAGHELGTAKIRGALSRSVRQVDGMASLLALFQTERWSPEWQAALQREAEKVSPSASAVTRAYRNSAFAIVRLKQAERSAEARAMCYADTVAGEDWLAPSIREVLPTLRKQIGKFRRGEAPTMLSGTLAWYAAILEIAADPGGPDSVDRLAELERNDALAFDPASYSDVLARLRYALFEERLAEPGAEEPAVYTPEEAAAVLAFRDVSAEGATPPTWVAELPANLPPYFRRWADDRVTRFNSRQEQLRDDLATNLARCGELCGRLRELAATEQDWTESWVEAHRLVGRTLGEAAGLVAIDETTAAQLTWLENFRTGLERPRYVRLARATVRLQPAMLAATDSVVLEIGSDHRGDTWRSAAITIGPSAPAGSGWVGTGNLDHDRIWPVDADLRVRVLRAADLGELFRVEYPALADGGGPGCMHRPSERRDGSLIIRVAPDCWSDLDLPPVPVALP